MVFGFSRTGVNIWPLFDDNMQRLLAGHHENQLMVRFSDLDDLIWRFSMFNVNSSTPPLEKSATSRWWIQTNPKIWAFLLLYGIHSFRFGWCCWLKPINSTESSMRWIARMRLSGENFMERIGPLSSMQNDNESVSRGPFTTIPVAPPERTAKTYKHNVMCNLVAEMNTF